MVLLARALIGLLSAIIAPSLITYVGFTSLGIAAGSSAASIQSSIGIVKAGSWFSAMQSAGATGLFSTVGVRTAIGVVVGTISGLF